MADTNERGAVVAEMLAVGPHEEVFGNRIHEWANALRDQPAARVGAEVVVPEGYVLVPDRIHVSPEQWESAQFAFGGPGAGIGPDDSDFLPCTLWVGHCEMDDGSKVHGLQVSCDECPEEGSITLAEFPPASLTPPPTVNGGRDDAERDADIYGTGFLVDGKRVAPDRVQIIVRKAGPSIGESPTAIIQPESALQGEDYTPGLLDFTAPPRVWLQIDTDGDNTDRSEAIPREAWPDLTWCYESIGGQEVQYVRADLAHPAPQESESGDTARLNWLASLPLTVEFDYETTPPGVLLTLSAPAGTRAWLDLRKTVDAAIVASEGKANG